MLADISHQSLQNVLQGPGRTQAISLSVSNDVERKSKVSCSCEWLAVITRADMGLWKSANRAERYDDDLSDVCGFGESGSLGEDKQPAWQDPMCSDCIVGRVVGLQPRLQGWSGADR